MFYRHLLQRGLEQAGVVNGTGQSSRHPRSGDGSGGSPNRTQGGDTITFKSLELPRRLAKRLGDRLSAECCITIRDDFEWPKSLTLRLLITFTDISIPLQNQ